MIQGLTSIFFLGLGLYFLFSKRLKSSLENRIVKASGWFLVVLGIFLALLMVVLPPSESWQTEKTVLLAVATVTNLFSGVYNLIYRRRVSTDAGTRQVAKIAGILLLILAAWTGMLFILVYDTHVNEAGWVLAACGEKLTKENYLQAREVFIKKDASVYECYEYTSIKQTRSTRLTEYNRVYRLVREEQDMVFLNGPGGAGYWTAKKISSREAKRTSPCFPRHRNIYILD